MAHVARTAAVQRFLLTSERFLFPHTASQQAKNQANHCVPGLRTCELRELTSEWVDPIQFRIDRVSQSPFRFGAEHKGGVQCA
jgi:hypothetical protein